MFCFLGRLMTRNQNLPVQTSHLENEVAYFRNFRRKTYTRFTLEEVFPVFVKCKIQNREWGTGNEQGERGTKLKHLPYQCLHDYPFSVLCPFFVSFSFLVLVPRSSLRQIRYHFPVFRSTFLVCVLPNSNLFSFSGWQALTRIKISVELSIGCKVQLEIVEIQKTILSQWS